MTPSSIASATPSRSSAARWVEASVRVLPADADAVAALLGDLAPGGAVIEPAFRASDSANFEYELLDAPGVVRACFPAPFDAAARRALRRRLAGLPLSAPLPRLRYAEVVERDWAEEWKRFFDVLHVGRRIVCRPSWQAYEPAPGEIVIELDPGRAFGTGQHPTTRLCLEALERRLRPGDDVIDVGAGSGILAIAAARLGARSVRALDLDGEAVAVARENVRRNGVDGVVRVDAGSLPAVAGERSATLRSADVIVANISSPMLVALASQAARVLRPGGVLIGSGFIDANAAEVEAAAVAAGFSSLSSEADGEWRCIVARAS